VEVDSFYRTREDLSERLPMTQADLHRADPSLLARILDVEEATIHAWPQHELGSILRHQLATPVQLDLEGRNSSLHAGPHALPHGQHLGKLTFGELLHHPEPPVELLRQIKHFAKASRKSGESALPAEIATVIYLMAIVVARLRCHTRISEQSDESLAHGIHWVQSQPWVDERTHQLFREALRHFSSSANASAPS
jgi:hypothetical protein